MTEFDRKMTRRIIFKNMKFNDFDGLHVSSLKAPPQSFWADLSNIPVTVFFRFWRVLHDLVKKIGPEMISMSLIWSRFLKLGYMKEIKPSLPIK